MKAKLTINRDNRGSISIRITDPLSWIEFVQLSMTPQDFANAVTGLGYVGCDMEVTGLEYVGKQRVTEKRSIVCPFRSYSREIYEDWLIANAQEEGWILETYLGSQDSIKRWDDTTTLNYRVVKFVEPENTE